VTHDRRYSETYRNEDELGLAAAERLEGALVAQHNLARLDDEGKLLSMLAERHQIVENQTELTLAPMDCASDLDFLTAIATVWWLVEEKD
jgi:hypothetical protein